MNREELREELNELCYLYQDLVKSVNNGAGVDILKRRAEKHIILREELIDKLINE